MAHASVSHMTERESILALSEALREMASCAREMAVLKDDKEWLEISDTLVGMQENCYKLCRMKAMSRTDVMRAIDLKMGNGQR